MRSEAWLRFTELFDEALERPRAEREDWLARLEGDDALLRGRLEEWLGLEDGARGFLEEPLAPGASWERRPFLSHGAGAVLGGYRVERVLGIGGTSVVYVARQLDPPREVALKVFQSGWASARARERFGEEARILADLRHPGIAQVFAAGSEGEGDSARPWIAMELVRGARTVTCFAREEALERPTRLRLFARLCDAVAHGHRRGVIHRDLKPANLLVDAEGSPKVIDFGVAKVLGDGIASSHATRSGSLIGTLAWMSPEQWGGDPSAVDTRTDVYALGVVLYELVCGELPHAFDEGSLEAAAKRARTEPVVRPSAHVELDRDLEAILLVALAKDPDARYASAAELSADLGRYLAREPVVARPPSVLHHLRLVLGRHRRAAFGVALALVLLVAALGLGAVRTSRVEARERARADDVTRFLKSVLALASPSTSPRADLTMREVLDDASGRIDAELADAPDARGELHALVGSAWRELGELERAETHLRSAVAVYRGTRPASWELAGALSILSEVLLAAGRGADAESVLLEARAIYTGRPDLPDFYVSIVTNKLAGALRLQGELDRAEKLALRALEGYRRSFGEVHVAVASALDTLAAIRLDAGRIEEAEADALEALRLHLLTSGDESLMVARARLALAEIRACGPRPDEARAPLERARQSLERRLPVGHADRARANALRARLD